MSVVAFSTIFALLLCPQVVLAEIGAAEFDVIQRAGGFLVRGHPTRDGTYHHHSVAPGPLEVLMALGLATTSTPEAAEIELYGIMCDGSLVLGCTELDGSAPTFGDLDPQGGHLHDIVDEGGTTHFTGRYHTHICPGSFPAHICTPEIQYYDRCTVTL